MEISEKNEYKVLQECLSANEIDQIQTEICLKLENFFRNKFDEFITAKAIFETNRKNLDQQLSKLNKEYQIQNEEFIKCKEKLKSSKKCEFDLESQINENKHDLQRLHESLKRLEKENTELKKQRDAYIDENNTLHSQIERKNSESERLREELTSLSSQLQAAVAAKCQMFTEVEEVKSREMSLDFKEKRFEQEKLLLTQQMISLEEELSKRTTELQNTRSEVSARALVTHTRLTQCEEELKITNESITQVRETNAMLQRRCEEMTQKLEDQRNHELTMHASYQEEITAQTRLADLYKGIADEANARANDYSNAVKELQGLLEHATEQYGALESKYNETLSNHDQQIIEKQKRIDELTKEVELANEILLTTKQERLDKAVEQLAPTAAAASRILKKGLTLTQIYTQLVEATNELSLEREENEKLKCHMEIILKELEEKAPILQEQRENYESAITNISTLTLKLDELLTENNRLQEESDEAKRLANHCSKDNEKLKLELADLARQVCYLLKEIQESRTGNTVLTNEENKMEIDELASSQIISKKLVTFKDIEGLQENNHRLLSIVRTLSSRQEEIEKATDQINSGEMKQKLDRYIEQLSDMQAAQERQAKMLDGLLKQRDMYKNMYQKCINELSAVKSSTENKSLEELNKNNSADSELLNVNEDVDEENKKWYKKYQDSEIKYNQLNSDFDAYKKEKVGYEKMLNEEIERLRKEAEKNSARCCRLKAQLDSANERFSLLQGNVVTYKSQIKILEEKCNNYSTTIGKHEQSLMILKDETLLAQSRLSKAEVQLENLRQERQLLRDSEGRLLKEREVLQRERHTHALLKADVEAIKISLERAQAEGQLRIEQRLDDATRESAALRRRLQEEQDRFRELSSHLERQINTFKQRLTEEKILSEKLQNELDTSRSNEQDCLKKIDELNSTLRQTSLHDTSKSMTGEDLLNKRIKELELHLANNQAEIKSLTDQLKAARYQSQQYCDIAESAEQQLRESSHQFNKDKEKIENSLAIARDELEVLKNKINESENKTIGEFDGQQANYSELKEKWLSAEQKLQEFDEIKRELELLKIDLKNASTTAVEAEDKYAREMVLHSADLQALTKLKEESHANTEKISSIMEQKNLAEEKLNIEKSMWLNREKRLQDEIVELQKQLQDLDAQNILLHNQIQDLGEKSVMMQSHMNKSDCKSPDIDFDNINLNEEDSKSTEQLFQVMKYLRREKDLAIAKLDVLKSENSRLKSQVELTEKRLEEIRRSFERERENSEINVVTVSKHSELLRKVETLNAITDSNRILREERDSLNTKIKDLSSKLNLLSNEIIPLREKARDLEAKNESLIHENNSLKNEAIRWRQRANSLVERANKASPEDWRRLQTERENLSKLLTSEREIHAKRMEELNSIKSEKNRLEEQVNQLNRQLQTQESRISAITEETHKMSQDLNNSISDCNEKIKEIESLKKTLADKDAMLADIKNKEIQIRKIAKKYKTQYEELAKSMEEEKVRSEDGQKSLEVKGKLTNEEETQTASDRGSQLSEESRSELRQVNAELISKIDDLNQQILAMQSESENLKNEIETINKASLEKEERAKQVLKGARTKIMQLTEYKKLCEKELSDLKEKFDLSRSECESNVSEYEARLVALKSQMEGRIARLEHERSDLQAEKDTLQQRAAQLQRQLAGQNNLSAGLSDPPTANIKPMSARTETPLASIRPMSVVVQSRTAAVLPTTAGAPLLLVPQQQQQLVHTTETSSPTSSHMDYQPATTSRQILVQPQLSESAESTQREETEIIEPLSVQQQQPQQQCQQQTVALVSPRVEQQQQQQQQTLPNDPQTIPSSSTQSVSTSHASISHKRPRTLDSTASGSNLNENIDHTRQEQICSPKTKRSRQQDLISLASANVSDIEYQVPTSSQRDQDEEGEDGCVVVVDCDEGGSTNQQQEEEEFDNDPYEEMEEEELPYAVEVEGDNNEVEIIIDEVTTAIEGSRQIQSGISNNQQQQSEAISSAGTNEDSTSFTTRSSRGIAPMPRQQTQHLLLPQQGYEAGEDDCIVPSTPTLFIPRRSDGFGEAVGSPQVPQSRFTFGDPSTSVAVSLTQSHVTPTVAGTRTIFSPSVTSGLAQVVQEGMDDTRIDLTQLEDGGSGRSVPTTPQQTSPASDTLVSITSGPIANLENSTSTSADLKMNIDENISRKILPNIQMDCIEESEDDQAEIITDSEVVAVTDDNPSENSSKNVGKTATLMSAEGEEDTIDNEIGVSEDINVEITTDDLKEENREAEASPSSNTRQKSLTVGSISGVSSARGSTSRRSTRMTFRPTRGTRPTPIVWDNQSSRGQNIVRGHAARGTSNEVTRVRGARGRRMRSKYPYSY